MQTTAPLPRALVLPQPPAVFEARGLTKVYRSGEALEVWALRGVDLDLSTRAS